MSAAQQRPVSASPGQDVWVRSVMGWHVMFAVMLAIAAAVAVTGTGGATRGALLTLLGALGAAYAVLAVPASRGQRLCPPWRAIAYVAVLIAVVGLAVWLEPAMSWLLLLACPQVWFLLPRVREAIAATVALTAATAGGYLASLGAPREDLRDIGVSMLISLVFSIALGVWISRVIDQSRQRAELIEQLQAAREELAAAHHAQGVAAERARMAGEIHDTLAQGFTSVIMLAQAGQSELERNPVAVRDRLAMIERTGRENLAEARALVGADPPAALTRDGLPGALRRLGESFGRETGSRVSVQVADLRMGLAADQEVVLLRAAQEALANVRKHAHAGSVLLRLDQDAARTAVEVSDDGTGFDLAGADGFGLAGMRRRVEEVGGTLAVRTSPGAGTRVCVHLPANPS